MNERIKELEKQAWEFVDKTWNWANANNPSQATLFKTKFAELIVRECMSMCDDVSNDYLKNRKAAFDFQDKNIYAEGEAACDILKFKMKTHFGVE
jgi:hypothetical protein